MMMNIRGLIMDDQKNTYISNHSILSMINSAIRNPCQFPQLTSTHMKKLEEIILNINIYASGDTLLDDR